VTTVENTNPPQEKMQEEEAKRESEGEKVEVTAPLVPPTLPAILALPPTSQTITTTTEAVHSSFAVASHTEKQSSAVLEDTGVPYLSKR